ncbi:MAG: YbjN domain-containing protein [Planctomycetes bacterium]|nr:YbjN domain-containing protein [Planctomycetota bacterium]
MLPNLLGSLPVRLGAVIAFGALLGLGGFDVSRAAPQDPPRPSQAEIDRAFDVLRRATVAVPAAAGNPLGMNRPSAGGAAGKRWTADDIVKFVQREGLGEARVEGQNLVITASGYQMLILIDETDADLMAYFGIIGSRKNDLTVPNDWNRDHKFSRAYVDSDGDYCLESDLLCSDGITEPRLREFLGLFLAQAQAYARVIP